MIPKSLNKIKFLTLFFIIFSCSQNQPSNLQDGGNSDQELIENLYQILRITNNEDDRVSTISVVESADNKIIALKTSLNYFTIDQINEGVTVLEKEERPIIKLKGQIHQELGGELKLEYLYNGISAKYKSVALELKSSTLTRWKILDLSESTSADSDEEFKTINRLHCIANRSILLNRTIGIKKIESFFE